MYSLDDPMDEADHVMPWRHIVTAALFGGVGAVLLAPIVTVLWLFSAPKDGGESAPPPERGALPAVPEGDVLDAVAILRGLTEPAIGPAPLPVPPRP